MEIVNKGCAKPFIELGAGDCFKYGNNWFIKINAVKYGSKYNAVCLRTGCVCNFSENEMVESAPNAKVVV